MPHKRGSAGRAGHKRAHSVSTSQTFTGSSVGMADQGPSAIKDPWLCGADGRGEWAGVNGEDTWVEVVGMDLSGYSLRHPIASGAGLAPLPLVKLGRGETLLDRMRA